MSLFNRKVPVILQMEALECGAASLCMILAYYKKWIPLDQARADCGVSRDGSNALNIFKAAEGYGLKVKANRFNMEQLTKEAKLPAIVWWNRNHFVVLTKIKRGKAYVNDPARGFVVMPVDEFALGYSKLCMQFEPGESFVPGGKPQSILGFLADRIKGNQGALALVVLTGILTMFAGILTPIFGRFFTDEILGGGSHEWLFPFLFSFALLIIFKALTSKLNGKAIGKATGKLSITTNAQFMWHILRMPMGFFEQRQAGDLAGRQQANDKVASTLINQVLPIGVNIFMLFFYLIVMVKYSPVLTVIGVSTSALNLLLARGISQKRSEISRTQMRDQGKLDSATISGIEMIETIKASGAENGFFEKWSGYHASVIKSKTEFSEINRYLDPLSSLLQTISSIIILAVGADLVMNDHLTVGMLLAFQSFMNSFLGPVNQIISAGQSLQEMKASMERIEDVMKYPADIPEEIEQPDESLKDATKLKGEVSVEHLTFGYARLSAPLIEDFSMKIKPGQRVAIVGPSGSGKSTIAKLLAGLYKPWEGEIRYDGLLISEIPRPVFGGSVSVVDQEIVLFEDTIQNNITMWDSTIKDFEMILAARDAGVHEDILARKGGYRHMLKAGGRNLSGGQRQRLEIARVLSEDPSVIIMDEATSALDAKTEYEVSEAIHQRGITCVIVAHRLSTIRDCDEIIVLDRGKIIERGKHEDLMKKNGLYRQLVSTE